MLAAGSVRGDSGVMTNILLLVAAAATQSFSFGGLTPEQEVTFPTEGLQQCVGNEVRGSCSLARDSFGGVRIDHSIVSIRDRHVDSIIIHGPSYQFDDAVGALKAKFGTPSKVDAFPSHRASGGRVEAYNWYFVDGVLMVSRDGDEPTFSFVFVSNRKPVAKVDF